MSELKKNLSPQHHFRLALIGSFLLHALLLTQGFQSAIKPQKPLQSASFRAQISANSQTPTELPSITQQTEAPINSPSEQLNPSPQESHAASESVDAAPAEIVFDKPRENPGMSTSLGWGGRRYQNEEQVRARTVSDMMQKLQPLAYQINPERCVLQTSNDARSATLQCSATKDQQQLLSGIGPFLNFTDQLAAIGACFTLVGTQITVTKKCAPF